MSKIRIAENIDRPLLGRSVDLKRYYMSMFIFFGFVSFLVFMFVEISRGILFPLSEYLKVGAPSAILYLDVRDVPLILIGVVGALLSYKPMTVLETGLHSRGLGLTKSRNVFAIAIMGSLMAGIILYRIIPASRVVAAGKIGIGQAMAAASFPAWLRPVAEAINYFALVWHATVLGILIGAMLLVLVACLLKPVLAGNGFKSHVAGALLAIPYPFCSCCASPIGATLFRGGASLGPTLAFVVSSPMLNVTGLVLAATLLPLPFAALRIAGGLIMAVLVTYLAAILSKRFTPTTAAKVRSNGLLDLSSKAVSGFSRWFQLENVVQDRSVDSAASLVMAWFTMIWRLAKVAVPVLFVGAIVAAAVVDLLPSSTNTLPGVIIAAAFGTIIMIPTWTELAIAGPLIQQGLNGPAAALLLTLPAVSLPCLVILGGATSNYRVPVILGTLVLLVGVLAGLWFRII